MSVAGAARRSSLVAVVWDVLLTPFVLPPLMKLFAPARARSGRGLMGAATGSAATSRLRLVVIQALVFSLFATLFVRLYYLQVVGGDDYQAQAADQSVRDIVVQPQRGLIVDDQGRPLVANRTSWVVSVDRTLLGKMAERPAHRAGRAGSPVVVEATPRGRRGTGS